MYKLVAIGGKLRGEEFVLGEGDQTLGRDPECEIHVDIEGVSKKHITFSVSGNSLYCKDLGSSNGTILNGSNITSGTLKSGDRIAVPDLILQVVRVEEKKIIIKKQVQKESVQQDDDDDEIDLFAEPMPQSPFAKILWFFKNRLMRIIHGFNQEYEWKVIVGIMTALFITTVIIFTIRPVLDTSRQLLLIESVKRGQQYAKEVRRLNREALATRNLNAINTRFLEEKDANVYEYELIDTEQRVISPVAKRNKATQNPFSISAVDFFLKEENQSKPFFKALGDGKIGVALSIEAYNPQKRFNEVIGVIAIIFQPDTLQAFALKNNKEFFEAWTTSAIFAIFFFGILYYLTVRPIQEMRLQIEQAMRGRRKGIESSFLFAELNPLKSSINSIIQRVRELQNDGEGDDFSEMEDDSRYVSQLNEFLHGADGAAMVLNSAQQIESINATCEDLIGLREASSKGSTLDEVAREEGLAAVIMSLCDQSANSDGTSQKELYEINGTEYDIFVTSLIGKDTFAKAFYVTFVKA